MGDLPPFQCIPGGGGAKGTLKSPALVLEGQSAARILRLVVVFQGQLRSHLTRVRTFCECIAFYGGQRAELVTANGLLDELFSARMKFARSVPCVRRVRRPAHPPPRVASRVMAGGGRPPPTVRGGLLRLRLPVACPRVYSRAPIWHPPSPGMHLKGRGP